jgi:hypothetical protein
MASMITVTPLRMTKFGFKNPAVNMYNVLIPTLFNSDVSPAEVFCTKKIRK